MQTAALMLLAAFLSLSVFAGSVTVMSLQNGLRSYQARLGADIVVVPNQARSHGTVDSILLEGIPGYFYMDVSKLEKIRTMDGVAAASPQFYLTSTSAGCCSTAVQIIGFDPETDFSIQPWIQQSYAGEVGDRDIIVGCNISVPTDGTLKFYNVPCRVVGQLDRTGTGLDSAVYANMTTIREMMQSSAILGFDYFNEVTADRAVSTVMVKVAEGYDTEKVAGNFHHQNDHRQNPDHHGQSSDDRRHASKTSGDVCDHALGRCGCHLADVYRRPPPTPTDSIR